jgi:hypothetical protein
MGRGVFGAAATKLIAPLPKPRVLKPSPSARVPLVIPRVVAPVLRPAPAPGSVFAEWAGLLIDATEERERIRSLRRQMCSAEFRGIPEELVHLVVAVPLPRPPAQRNHFHVTDLMKSLSVVPTRKYSS